MTADLDIRAKQADALYARSLYELQSLTDRVFSFLLVAQWAAVVLCAFVVSPRTWSGPQSSTHAHVISAVLLGGLLTVFPVWLALSRRGEFLTRFVIASAQVLFSALLIHLMGGRIEAHFHIFGSLALLSFYRDFRVFVPAVLLVLGDHIFRSLYWPQSVFGASAPELGRALEHAGWVLFEVAFLLWGIAQSRDHLWRMADLQASLEEERDTLEARVERRTKQLAEARDFLENVIDSFDAHLCIIDANGLIVSTNSAWRDFGKARGGDPNKIDTGANYLSICRSATGSCEASARRLADAIESIVAGQSDKYMAEYACHEPGRQRWFQVQVSPFIGGGQAAAVVMHIDVTDRVVATKSSQEEARRAADLAQIVTESPNEVYIFNQVDLNFVVVNEGAARATGYTREELLRMTPLDLKADTDIRTFRERLAPLVRDKVRVLEFQATHCRKDGTTYPIQVSMHAAVFHSTPVYVTFVTDLTEVRRLEGRLAQSQKLESIGQLAAGIAHEINTPMQCVSNNVEFLQDCQQRLFDVVDTIVETLDAPARSWDDRKLTVHKIIEEARYHRVASMAPSAITEAAEASRRVIEIVRAMKVMSHPGTREFVDSDLNDGIRNAATIARNRWKYVAEVEFDLDESLPHVPVLPSELNQVFLNLIVNAADAIAEKNGENGPLGKIALRTRYEGDTVRIEVADSGTGVPEAIRDRIFDPFFTTKDVGKGTGQGLAITYDVVVNKHHGTIDLLSTEGEGATFVICLPMSVDVKEEFVEAPAVVSGM